LKRFILDNFELRIDEKGLSLESKTAIIPENEVFFMHAITDSYESWKRCLAQNLGQELTLNFVQERVRTLGKKTDPETKKFISIYGPERAAQVLSWFTQLEQEMRSS
jgi:hypothetical protein